MAKLQFPALNSTVKKRLANEPKDGDPRDPLCDVEIEIRLVGAQKARIWMMKAQKQRLEEVKRLAALRKEVSRETAPEFWEPFVLTPEGATESSVLAREVLTECITAVLGVQIGQDDISHETNASKLVDALEAIGGLEKAFSIAITAQSPTPEQTF